MLILNLGCGVNRRRLYTEPFPEGTIHVDMNPDVGADLVCDLNNGLPMSMVKPDGSLIDWKNKVDEIHAYHLIEHIGRMGETETWFRFWRSCWQALKPGGLMFIDAPYYLHEDAIGDPTHTRLICVQTFIFLDRSTYQKKDGDRGCAQSKLAIDFDFKKESDVWIRKNREEQIPCGIRVVLRARKTVEGGLVPLEHELQGAAK